MDNASFTRLLGPLSVAVFVGGWILAIASYFIVGTETCATVPVPLVGELEACQDTSATAILLVIIVGFVATVSATLLFAMHLILTAVNESKTGPK